MADTLRRGSPRKAKPLPGTMYYKPNKYAGPRRTKSKALIQTTTKTQMRASVKRRASAPAAMRTQHDSDTDSLTSLETSDDQDEDKENRNVKRDGDKEKQDDEDIDEAAAQQAEYERQRAENIRANMELLMSLGIYQSSQTEKKKTTPASRPASPTKVTMTPTRRSTRVAQSTGSRTGTSTPTPTPTPKPAPAPPKLSVEEELRRLRFKNSLQLFGPPKDPNVDVGSWFATLAECAKHGVHDSNEDMAGNEEVGLWSLCLDASVEDLGHTFVYSTTEEASIGPTQGRMISTRSSALSKSYGNKAAILRRSSHSRRSVRVIRKYQPDNVFAPPSGYVYCGLYRIEKSWVQDNVLKFKFARKTLQPFLPRFRVVRQPDPPSQYEPIGPLSLGSGPRETLDCVLIETRPASQTTDVITSDEMLIDLTL